MHAEGVFEGCEDDAWISVGKMTVRLDRNFDWVRAVRHVREVDESFEEVMKAMVLGAAYRPSVAITFRVEHVYQQTPGPGAGEGLV